MITYDEFEALKLPKPSSQHMYIKDNNIVKELYINKKYYKFYYDLTANTETDITNTIETSNRSSLGQVELMCDFIRQNQQAWFKKQYDILPPDVRGLSLNTIPTDAHENWVYTEKTDGYNCFIKIGGANGGACYQAEYLDGMFYVYDYIDMTKVLSQRLEELQKLKTTKSYQPKKFYPVESFKIDYLQSLLKKKWKENTDGIVFSHLINTYKDQLHLKLKPKKYLTNDYLYIFDSAKKLYHLQVQGNRAQFYWTNTTKYKRIQDSDKSLFDFAIPYVVASHLPQLCFVKDALQHTDKKLQKEFKDGGFNGKIIETAYTDEMIPYPIRVRSDKLLPNGYQTCLTNFENRMCPIDDYVDDGYFNVQKDEKLEQKYKDFTTFGNNARKECLQKAIKMYDSQIKCVFDFGAGRGVNYHILFDYKILSLEPDKRAWITQFSRMRDIQGQRKTKMKEFYIFDYDSLDFILAKNKYDLFISDYSIHYMLGNTQNVNTVIDLMSRAKVCQLLYYNGERVFNLLKKHNFEYKTDKYYIKSKKMDKLKDYGQMIYIKLPTISQEITQEFLVNIDYIIKRLEPKKKDIISFATNDEYLNLVEGVILVF